MEGLFNLLLDWLEDSTIFFFAHDHGFFGTLITGDFVQLDHSLLELLNHVDLIIVRLVVARVGLGVIRIKPSVQLLLISINTDLGYLLHETWCCPCQHIDVLLVEVLKDNFLTVFIN